MLGVTDDRLHIERLGAGVARLLSLFDFEGIPVQAQLIDTLNGYLPEEIHDGATAPFHDCSKGRLAGLDAHKRVLIYQAGLDQMAMQSLVIGSSGQGHPALGHEYAASHGLPRDVHRTYSVGAVQQTKHFV